MSSKATVGYISDIEGNYDYWQQYINRSKVLVRGSGSEVLLRDHCHFVCGGDVCDRGDGDIRVLRELLALQSAYPDRVHFILGNRDLNKLRLPFSLHESTLSQKPECYWFDSSNLVEHKDYELHDLANRMQWLLKNTMGSPFSFECRRRELQLLGLASDDTAVAQSYLNLVLPPENGVGGELLTYIKRGKMAVVIEDALFVHGGICEDYVGYVPPAFAGASSYETEVHAWVARINAFATAEIVDYENRVSEYLRALTNSSRGWDLVGGYDHPQPGSRLVMCGMGTLADNSANPTVIYTSYLRGGKLSRPTTRVVDWLHRSNVHKLVVGHQPVGDSPLVVPTNELTVFSADICYSKFVQYPASDLATADSADEQVVWRSAEQQRALQGDAAPNDQPHHKADTRARGCIAEVTLSADEEQSLRACVDDATVFTDARTTVAQVEGVLSSGHTYVFALPDELIGRVVRCASSSNVFVF